MSDSNEWNKATAEFFQNNYNDEKDSPLSVQSSMYDAVVGITLQSTAQGQRRRLSKPSLLLVRGRKLQTSSVEVTYSQTTTYRTTDPSLTIEEIVQAPLSTERLRDQYVNALKQIDGYESLTDVSTVTLPDNGGDSDQIVDGSDEANGPPLAAIVGGTCGGAAALVLLGGFIYMQRKKKKADSQGDRGTSTQSV